jgi:flagellar hook protein FlgE
MDVVGNNISNVNTTGFKRGRVTFQDMIYQQSGGAAKPTAEVGGVNPKEVGLGMQIAAIDTLHTQGSLQSTGVVTDLAINGQGFFVLADGENQVYTRAGDFNVDENGTLVNPGNGLKVQGWMAENIGGETIVETSRNVGDITIPIGGKDPARETSRIEFACNLDKRMPTVPPNADDAATRKGTWNTSIEVYDTFGQKHELQAAFR